MGQFILLEDIHNIVVNQSENNHNYRMTTSSSTSSLVSAGDYKSSSRKSSHNNDMKRLEDNEMSESASRQDNKRNSNLYKEKAFFLKNHFSIRNIQKIIEYFLVDEDELVRKAALLTLIHLHSNNIQLHITLYRQLKKLLKDTNEDVRIAAMNAIWY